jgi:hypothetical protein
MSQLNQLYCPGCHCPWSIFQFPLKDSWRTATCASCLERQALQYVSQKREREEEEREGGKEEGEGKREGVREEGKGEQAISKLTDLFTDRLTLPRATALLKLLTTPRSWLLFYLRALSSLECKGKASPNSSSSSRSFTS